MTPLDLTWPLNCIIPYHGYGPSDTGRDLSAMLYAGPMAQRGLAVRQVGITAIKLAYVAGVWGNGLMTRASGR